MYLIAIPFQQGVYLTGILLSMILLRIYIGGMHMKTFWSCFIVGMIWIIGGMIIGKVCIYYNEFLLSSIAVVSMIGLAVTGIQVSSKKKQISKKTQQTRKSIALGIEAILIVNGLLWGTECIFCTGLLVGLIICNAQVIILKMKGVWNEFN